MNPRIILFMLLAFAFTTVSVQAQQDSKALKKEIKKKAVKPARKEAKKLKKQGYAVAPGALPLAKQVEDAWMRGYERDEDGFPLYIIESGKSVANTTTAAKLQASETAKLILAGSIATRVAALIETNIANQQFNSEEAASVTKTVAAAKNIIAQELGRTIPLFEIYRTLDNKNIEANVRIAYNSKKADEVAIRAISKKLEEETDITQEKLEKLMKWEN